MKELELGNQIRCRVTGFLGIATARAEYLNGCTQLCLMPEIGKDKEMPKGQYIDIQQLEFVADGLYEFVVTPTNAAVDLGEEMFDMVTGFTGIATARYTSMNGTIEYCLTPKQKEGKGFPEGQYIDVNRLKFSGNKLHITKKPTGGPQMNCPSKY